MDQQQQPQLRSCDAADGRAAQHHKATELTHASTMATAKGLRWCSCVHVCVSACLCGWQDVSTATTWRSPAQVGLVCAHANSDEHQRRRA